MIDEKFETHEHDVLIIGAGGAGLRAAIEALGHGARVGVVCKSLLGKAHTVMAEGGIAAAMANVDTADDWRMHFRDTMRGGKFLTTGAWPKSTRRSRPIEFASSSSGARCSIARTPATFCNERSVGTLTSVCVTSATAPVSR